VSYPIKNILRSRGAYVVVTGSFSMNGTNINANSIHPNRPDFSLNRFAAGVYGITLTAPAQAIVSADAEVGPDLPIGVNSTTPIPTANTAQPMISQQFLTALANGTNYAADNTNTKMVMSLTNGSALIDIPANYRCSFQIILAESALTK
jgi:hypothetical protein